AEAGIMLGLLHRLMPTHPILGVCLGMQGIVQVCGGTLYNQQHVMHGVAVPCIPAEPRDPLFAGLPSPFDVALYHSSAADPATVPAHLRITARSAAGVIMGIRHVRHKVCGIQFHPESILTPLGAQLVANWIAEE